MAYSVYILKSKIDGNLYIGQTENISRRLEAHFEGHVKSTKNRRPLTLVHIEHFDSRSEAMRREKEIKRISSKDFKRRLRKRSFG
ncbi:MAG: hypothetical protein A2W25_05385 [candidate division Zixibacteria bacterium RBG_16_53_22]|nr:MAG: hypothetical protein A2W25_05385 [candidate division Zixibacteria bacterium RBG_16_53_22]